MNKINLALIGKLIKLYELEDQSEEVFISLETTPMPYTDKDFMFIDEAGDDAQKLRQAKQNQQQFFEQTDLIPKVSRVWQTKFGEFSSLSNVYDYVLKRVIPLDENLSDDQEKRYRKSKELISSKKRKTYDEYKEKYQKKENELIDLKLRLIETEGDEKAEVLKEKKEILVERLNNLKQEWIAQGFKNEIENALATFSRLDNIKNSSVRREWSEAKHDFNNLDRDAVFSEMSYKPTFYRPINFNDKGEDRSGWKHITIRKEEIDELAGLADKTFYSKGKKEINHEMEYDIEKISVEIIDLTIDRPWFNESMLMQRNWSLPKGDPMLSAGDSKTKEEMLPAYMLSMFMARNVNIELAQTERNRKKLKQVQAKRMPLQIGPMLLDVPKTKTPQTIKEISMPKKLNAVKANLFRKKMKAVKAHDPKNKKSAQTKTSEVDKNLKLLQPKLNLQSQVIKPLAKPVVKGNIVNSQAVLNPVIATPVGKLKVFGFKGRVEGEGLAGKKISLRFMNIDDAGKSKVVETDKDGHYTAKLDPGSYKIVINREGYEPFKETYRRKKGQKSMRQVDIYLQKKPDIQVDESNLEKQFEGYLLLGYKCRKLPKLPNPDPELISES